jgi:hypothetical protein
VADKTGILELQKERMEGWTWDLVDKFPPITAMEFPIALGAFSWSATTKRYKWLNREVTIVQDDTPLTPGDIARNYLTLRGWRGLKRRMTTEQFQYFFGLKRSAPLLAIPGDYEDMVYYDLKSAYWSILRRVGWGVEYNPGKWLAFGERVNDFPYADHKLARNCLVTVGVVGKMNFWDGQQIKLISKANPFANQMLYGLVIDTLHAIALDMKDAGAVYVHTDGYILPARHEGRVAEIGRKWGFDIGRKGSGRCSIWSVGHYSIEGVERGTGSKFRRQFENLSSFPVRDWFSRSFLRLSEKFQD